MRQGPHPLGLYYALAQQEAAKGALNMDDFLRGVAAYQASEQAVLNPTVAYEKVGAIGRGALWRCRPGQGGKPILLIPSFVNTADIFDVHPALGLVGQLAAAGYDVHLLTWGRADIEQPLDMDIAVQNVGAALAVFDQPVPVLGYCAGGCVAVAAAQMFPDLVAALVLAAVPWDFHATLTYQQHAAMLRQWAQMVAVAPVLHKDVVQAGFILMDVPGTLGRIGKHGLPMGEAERARLIAIEDWLGNPVDLDQAVARTLLVDWHLENKTLQGQWQVSETVIEPQRVECPTLVVMTEKDHLVPPAASKPLLQMPEATALQVTAGHVGLMAGRAAVPQFMEPMIAWLDSTLAD